MINRPTRGVGFIEPLLAKLRARRANLLIPEHLRKGRILDIGCGSSPYFLAHTYFKEKFAVEQAEPSAEFSDIKWHTLNLNLNSFLPFDDQFFSVVTMLAVLEHLNPDRLVFILRDIYRILHPGGVLIVTTPAAWSDSLLRRMAQLRLVSTEEIDEHVYAYTLPLIGWYFGIAGFPMTKVKFGYFEFLLNLWGTAER